MSDMMKNQSPLIVTSDCVCVYVAKKVGLNHSIYGNVVT